MKRCRAILLVGRRAGIFVQEVHDVHIRCGDQAVGLCLQIGACMCGAFTGACYAGMLVANVARLFEHLLPARVRAWSNPKRLNRVLCAFACAFYLSPPSQNLNTEHGSAMRIEFIRSNRD